MMAGCGSSSGNPKVPAGAKSSGGLHGVIETTKGPVVVAVTRARVGSRGRGMEDVL